MSSLISTNSDIIICSNALLLLAHPSINSFDEPGAGATLSKSFYPNTYRMFIAESNWNFATKYQQLSQLVEKPTNKDYQYMYQLPSDYCRITTASNNNSKYSNYEIQGTKILSNENELYLEYQSYVDEINLPPYAVETLQYLMASKMAYPLTNDGRKVEIYNNLYIQSLRTSRFIDSQNDVNSGFFNNSLVDVRD